MARSARVYHPGGVYHLVSRFARDDWWLDHAGARDAYLVRLGRALAGTDTECLAYCLMSNHIHLVVVHGNEPLGRLTKSVHTSFAEWVRNSNSHRKNALGPVFAGRPFSRLVERESYLLELVRYVHNNPVRARVARRAANSEWSSHQAYIGQSKAPEWLRLGFALDQFGKRAPTMRRRFDEFVEQGRHEGRRPEFSGGDDSGAAAKAVQAALGDGYRVTSGILGGDEFVKRVSQDSKRVQVTLGSRGREISREPRERIPLSQIVVGALATEGLEPWDLEHRPRARAVTRAKRLATWIWVQQYGGQQIEVARELKVTTGAVSQWYRAAMQDAACYEEAASNLVSLLETHRRQRGKLVRRRKPEAANRVRYQVDVDE